MKNVIQSLESEKLSTFSSGTDAESHPFTTYNKVGVFPLVPRGSHVPPFQHL